MTTAARTLRRLPPYELLRVMLEVVLLIVGAPEDGEAEHEDG
jgi:hypothetical protein